MVGSVLSPGTRDVPPNSHRGRRWLRTIGRQLGVRIFHSVDLLLFPEASSASMHWQRTVMNEAVSRYLIQLGPGDLHVAEISGANHADIPWLTHTNLNFPEFDICAEVASDMRFDVVICEQVLEHVVDPLAAAHNLRKLCVEGGHVVVSTPFLIRVHELPDYGMKDYWRFTPNGLKLLLEQAGLAVEGVQTWGNRACVIGNFDRWSALRSWHPLRNEADLPVQVWAFARA